MKPLTSDPIPHTINYNLLSIKCKWHSAVRLVPGMKVAVCQLAACGRHAANLPQPPCKRRTDNGAQLHTPPVMRCHRQDPFESWKYHHYERQLLYANLKWKVERHLGG